MKVKELIEQLKGSEESEVKCMVYGIRKDGVLEVLCYTEVKVMDNAKNGDAVVIGAEVKQEDYEAD